MNQPPQYNHQPGFVTTQQPSHGYYPPPPDQQFRSGPQQGHPQYYPPPPQNYGPAQQNYGPPQPGYGPPQHMGPPPGGHTAPGLQALLGTSKIVVKQKKEMLEIFTSWETNNRYEIFNDAGQQILFALEDTSGLAMCFFGENRPFCIRILDRSGQQVMVVQSSVDCCTREATVELPPGQLVAQIKQEFAFMAPSFYVSNPGGSLMFKVKSPVSAAFGLGSANFDILSSDGQTVVGQITKQWGGFLREAFTDADTFGLTVPADMDVKWKAILLAVTFVVDFEFYEKSNRNR